MITPVLTWISLVAMLATGFWIGNWWLFWAAAWLMVGVWYAGAVMALFQYLHPIDAASMYWKCCLYFIGYAFLGPLMGKSSFTIQMLEHPRAGWTMPSLRSWRYARKIEQEARTATLAHLMPRR